MAYPNNYEAGSSFVNLLEVGQAATVDGLATFKAGTVRNTVTVTANYTVLATDDTVLMNSGTAKTITLPDATTVPVGRRYSLKNIGAGAVTVKSAGGTIDGIAAGTGDTTSLASQFGHGSYMGDGTNWWIV